MGQEEVNEPRGLIYMPNLVPLLDKKRPASADPNSVDFFDFYEFYCKGKFGEERNYKEILGVVNSSLTKGHPGVSMSLIRRYPEVLSMRDKNDYTPVYLAGKLNNRKLIDFLINMNFDPNIGQNKKKGTIMHSLMKSEHMDIEIFKKIISLKDFNASVSDSDGNTP